MSKKRRRFTAEFKKRVAVEALRERDTVQAIAARYEVHPNQVSAWKRQAVEGLDEVFSRGPKRGSEHKSTIRDLHAKIGELTVERIFSARTGALSRAERVARALSRPGVVHHLHPRRGGLLLSGGGDGLGQPACPVLAPVEHDGQRILRHGARRGATPGRVGHLQHGPGGAVHQPGVHGAGAR